MSILEIIHLIFIKTHQGIHKVWTMVRDKHQKIMGMEVIIYWI